MAPETRILISHEDGRAYSVTRDAFTKIYKPQGFTAGEPEAPSDFVANVPKPVRRAGARRKTSKPARPSARPAAAPTPADEPEGEG